MRLVRTKTDKKDAAMIREYGISEQPDLWQPDAPLITKLKQLNAALDLIEKHNTASSNQLEAFKSNARCRCVYPSTWKTILPKIGKCAIISNKKWKK